MPCKLNQAGIARTAENLNHFLPQIYTCLLDILENDITGQFKDCEAYTDFSKYELFLIADSHRLNTSLMRSLTASDKLSDIQIVGPAPFQIRFRVWFIFQRADHQAACPSADCWEALSHTLKEKFLGQYDTLSLAGAYLIPIPDFATWAIPGACQALTLNFVEKVSQQEFEHI